jgi:CRP/FNR family transcriptional regulator, polysaccharide utilization system transcription regulator
VSTHLVPPLTVQTFGVKKLKLDPSTFVADPELIQALEKRSTCVSCNEERVLFRQGESPVGLFVLNSGTVTLNMDSAFAESIISVQAIPGSVLGLPGLVGNQPYTLTAIAHPGASLSFITRENFTSLMQNDPLMSLKVLQILAAEVRSARNAILDR